jgi:toxin CcdB
MACLDVFTNPDRGSRAIIPCVLEVQSNLLDALPSCVVVPLAHPETVKTLPILRLNPYVVVDGIRLIALTQELASIPRRLLKIPVANLTPQRDEILAALNFLFTGL